MNPQLNKVEGQENMHVIPLHKARCWNRRCLHELKGTPKGWTNSRLWLNKAWDTAQQLREEQLWHGLQGKEGDFTPIRKHCEERPRQGE